MSPEDKLEKQMTEEMEGMKEQREGDRETKKREGNSRISIV
jgi:hypothetical protein